MNTAGRDPGRIAVSVVVAAFICVSVFVVNLFPRFRSPNEFSRYELVVSMAEAHTFSIDRAAVQFGRTEDVSEFGGRLYSNKAPGLALAALPFYFLFRPFTGPATPAHFAALFLLLRLCTVTAAVVIALIFLARRLQHLAGDRPTAALILFAVAFGTPLLVYARSFFSHAWTAALLYLAFESLHARREKWWHGLLAGILAGWAVLSEYPAVILMIILLVDAGWKKPRRGALFILGGIPAAALLFFYDTRCFGGAFSVSSAHEAFPAYAALAHSRFFGFGVPRLKIALEYLFSLSRGVLFESPFFLFLPAALASSRVRGRPLAFSLVALALFFIVMDGYANWHGGWCLGSRYLLPALFFAAWPLAGMGGSRRGRAAVQVFAVLAVFAASFFFLSGATFWFLPHEPPLGIRFYSAWWLLRGWVTPTLSGSSAAVLLLPAAVTLAAAVAAIYPVARGALRTTCLLACGLLLLALLFAGPAPAGTFGERLTRAWIFDTSSALDPGHRELFDMGEEVKTSSQLRLWRGAVAH